MDYASRRAAMRRLVFYSPQLSRVMLSGEFRSAFKGRGVDFDSLREYDVNDDALRIDWNGTVRHGHPFVKTYVDDRGLSVFLLVDRSASMRFGQGRSRYDTAALTAALLVHACLLNGIEVGGLLFGETKPARPSGQTRALRAATGPGELFRPSTLPADRRRLIAALLRGTAYAEPAGQAGQAGQVVPAAASAKSVPSAFPGSPLAESARLAGSVLKKQTMVFVFSDFQIKDYPRSLSLLAQRHELIPVLIRDRSDDTVPATFLVGRVHDAETGSPALFAPGSGEYRRQWQALAKERRLEWLSLQRLTHMPSLELDSTSDPARSLIQFFRQRRRERA